jgi:hypothetical protein
LSYVAFLGGAQTGSFPSGAPKKNWAFDAIQELFGISKPSSDDQQVSAFIMAQSDYRIDRLSISDSRHGRQAGIIELGCETFRVL